MKVLLLSYFPIVLNNFTYIQQYIVVISFNLDVLVSDFSPLYFYFIIYDIFLISFFLNYPLIYFSHFFERLFEFNLKISHRMAHQETERRWFEIELMMEVAI